MSLVRFPLEPPYFFINKNFEHALVAQLDRVFGYEPKGQGFESLRAHHIGKWLNLVEHLVWDQGVAGSNPVFPTIEISK